MEALSLRNFDLPKLLAGAAAPCDAGVCQPELLCALTCRIQNTAALLIHDQLSKVRVMERPARAVLIDASAAFLPAHMFLPFRS